MHLRAFELKVTPRESEFPFTVPAVRTLPRITLTSPVTFFVGGNGSGKSTVLEAIALATRFPAVGADDLDRDATLGRQRVLSKSLRLVWNKRPFHGFFLRAEDFFGYAKRMARLEAELAGRVADVEREMSDASPYARGLAAGPALGSLSEMERMYDGGLDARSHGEAFLRLFDVRLHAGMYLIDEPEAALSPQSQLAFMAMMSAAVARGAQFIIATHSPIILAYPGAMIVSFDSVPIHRVEYADLEHVNLTRDFLNDPGRFLRRVLRNDAG